MIDIGKNVLVSKYTTFGVGGPADFFVLAKTKGELIEALEYAKKHQIMFTVIGAGSNILIHDAGYRGMIIVNKTKDFALQKTQKHGTAVLKADSGSILSSLARETVAAGLLGLEFAANIPGTVGGAVSGNAGAMGSDISSVLLKANVWHNGKSEVWENADFAFSYRNSKIRVMIDPVIILDATFILHEADTAEAVALILSDAKRRSASYVGRTCGSYFKNPEGRTAGEMIDSLGLKGHKIGGAEISLQHANVIRNIGKCTASDIYKLEKYIQTKVYTAYGIWLEPEVVKLGF